MSEMPFGPGSAAFCDPIPAPDDGGLKCAALLAYSDVQRSACLAAACSAEQAAETQDGAF